MKAFKRTLWMLAAAAAVFGLAACGKAGAGGSAAGSAAPGDTSGAAGTVTIQVANYAILESGYTEFWENVKKNFEERHPNIKIEWVTAPYGEIVNQVMNMAGAGKKVDAIFSEMIWVPGLVDAGLAAPMDKVLDKEFMDDYYPNILAAHAVDGVPYAAPLYVSPSVLFYNKEIFAQAGLDPNKPPASYEEMLAMAEKLSGLKTSDGNKIYAFGQPTASVPVVGASLTAMMAGFGGSLFDADGRFDAQNPGFVQAMDMLKLLDDKGYCPQNAKPKDLRNLFALGQLAMYYDNAWGFNGIKSINPEAAKFIAAALPLKGGDGKGESTMQSHCFVAVDNGPEQLAAVKAFIQYVISPDVLSDYLKNITPGFPARKSMEGTLNPVLEGAKDAVKISVPSKMFPKISDFYLELDSLAQAVTVGDQEVEAAIGQFVQNVARFVE